MTYRNFWICFSLFFIFNFTEAKVAEKNDQNLSESSRNDAKEEDDTFYGSLVKLEIPDSYKLKEVVIGSESAPVKFIVYSSFTCNHCRKFAMEILPKFKEKYIDTGKVKVYLRNYLDDVAALEASILVRCVGEDKGETILKMYRKIFENQKDWMSSNEPREFLKKIFIDSGYEAKKIDACSQNKKIPAGLMKEQQRAMQQLHIFSVPAFIRSDGKMHIGKITLEELEEFLELKTESIPEKTETNPQNVAETKEETVEDKDKTILGILKELLDFKKIRKKLKIELRKKKKKSKSDIEDRNINKAIAAA